MEANSRLSNPAGWALITGGASGIGRATVARLAESGISGLVLDQHEAADLPSGWTSREVDISDTRALGDLVHRLRAERDSPRLLVQAAGVNGTASSAFEVDVEEWDRVHAVNLRGSFFLGRDVLAWMGEHGRGSIINVASQLATAVVRPNPHYQIAKAGVLQLTRTLALEGASCGVSVNTVSPGIVATPMTNRVMSDASWAADRLARIPMGRFADPGEIAEVIAALGLLTTPYLTGAEIVVDGGYLLA